jgi:hypothetical protein
MRSVPPRGSGWVMATHYSFRMKSLLMTHPLPRLCENATERHEVSTVARRVRPSATRIQCFKVANGGNPLTPRFVIGTVDPTLPRYGTDFMASVAFSHSLFRAVVLTS